MKIHLNTSRFFTLCFFDSNDVHIHIISLFFVGLQHVSTVRWTTSNHKLIYVQCAHIHQFCLYCVGHSNHRFANLQRTRKRKRKTSLNIKIVKRKHEIYDIVNKKPVYFHCGMYSIDYRAFCAAKEQNKRCTEK